MTISTDKAIIQVTLKNKDEVRINYSRRMYAIIKKYTPNVKETDFNECVADLTGLRTFFKMSYKEIAKKILNELDKELSLSFRIKISSYNIPIKSNTKKIYTYKEMNKLFFNIKNQNNLFMNRRKLIIPFLGKVS